MPTKQPTPAIIEQDNMIDRAILGLLMQDASHRPWTVAEVEREIGEETEDGVARLFGSGLIHKLDDFVWASRAAVMADDIRAFS
jgi:hypothetical protein